MAFTLGTMTATTTPLEISRYRSLIWNLAQRELRSRFKGTTLGWLWSLIVPLSSLVLYSIVFGIIFRTQAPAFGNGRAPIYAVWLFVGLIAFSFFSNGVIRGTESVWAVAGLMQKVYFPIYTPVIGALIAVGLQTLVEIALVLSVLAFFGNISWTWLLFIPWSVLFFAFTAGMAMLSAVVSTYFRDTMQLLAVLLQFLFFATPVMYPLRMIPENAFGLNIDLRRVIVSSPIARFVEMARALLYELHPGRWTQWTALTLCATASLAIGLFAVTRFGHDVAERV